MTQLANQPNPSLDSGHEHLTQGEMEAHQAFFAENGYVVLRKVVSRERLADLVAQLQAEFERVRGSGALFSGGGLMSGHLNCYPGEAMRFAYDAVVGRGIVNLVRAIAPWSTRLPNLGCNFNLPGSVTQHYHPDREFRREFLIVNIAAVDTDLVNGAIELAPGTHRKFYKFWRWALERPDRHSVRVPMQQGDVLIRSSNLWHRGMPNLSKTPRPMLALTWEDGGSTLDDPFQWEGGRIQFRPNWFRPTRIGRLRERIFVTAPITYSTYRFVRSLYGTKGY